MSSQSVLSLSPLTVLPCSPLDGIDAAYAAGYDAVGLRLRPTLPTDIDVMADIALLRAIERSLASKNLRVFDIEVVRVGPQTDIAALEETLRYAAALGAQSLQTTSFGTADYKADDEPEIARKLAELCELASRYGIRPMLEFMAFRGIATLEQAVRIASLTGHSNIGVCVDALHLFRSGGTAASVARIDPRLIACIQLCDAPAATPEDLMSEARNDRLHPGEGGLPLRALLQAVPASVPLSVEVPNRLHLAQSAIERATDGLRHTRELLSTLGRA